MDLVGFIYEIIQGCTVNITKLTYKHQRTKTMLNQTYKAPEMTSLDEYPNTSQQCMVSQCTVYSQHITLQTVFFLIANKNKKNENLNFQLQWSLVVCTCGGLQVNLQVPCVLYIGQAFRYSPENAFYIFNQQIYFII